MSHFSHRWYHLLLGYFVSSRHLDVNVQQCYYWVEKHICYRNKQRRAV